MPRSPRSAFFTALLAGALAGVLACAAGRTGIAPAAPATLAAVESRYGALRDLRDRIDVAAAAGSPREDLVQRYDSLRPLVDAALAAIDSAALHPEDRRALVTMRQVLDDDTTAPATALDSLRARIYAAYGDAQSRVVVEGDTVDRLTVLGLLGRTDDAGRRRTLFLALAPVWRSIAGEGGASSPYRRLLALEAAAPGAASETADQVRAAGVPPDSLEGWLLGVLGAWRDATPDSLVEPWDWFWENGRASRHLSPRVPRDRLLPLAAEVYRALGVDVGALGVHYDLAPRPGKDPVAFTTFGARAARIEPWVFATYRDGGLDNLNELLHETGHAAHIAAIRTRPAFRDWPDSDPFTEAVADFVALDVYDPAWQRRWLGDTVPLVDGLRARYGGVVLDIAWALFERQMLRDPSADPNAVWTALTRDYLRIRPHPELAWWAMRGQLVDAPGYMMNYAAGSILIAAIRARTREARGPYVAGDRGWYAWVAPRLFRFGLERPTREVVEAFLGGPVTPRALLEDLARMRRP